MKTLPRRNPILDKVDASARARIGLGDRIHAVAGPIGRTIHWPCLKGDGSTDLKPKSLCNYLRLTANVIKI